MNIKTTLIKPTRLISLGSVACVALLAALACSDDEADAPAGGGSDAGSQGGSGGSGGNGQNDVDGGAGASGASNVDAGDDAGVCEIDTAAAVDGCEGETIDIAGEYTDDFGGSVSIGSCSIYGSPVTELSNAEQYVITQNACDLFFPGKWSRTDWTWYSGDGGAAALYVCTSTYDADSEAEAIAAPPADASDPVNGGCGGFSWSLLTPVSTNGQDAGSSPSDASVDAADGG
jgi:hypothetical protein